MIKALPALPARRTPVGDRGDATWWLVASLAVRLATLQIINHDQQQLNLDSLAPYAAALDRHQERRAATLMTCLRARIHGNLLQVVDAGRCAGQRNVKWAVTNLRCIWAQLRRGASTFAYLHRALDPALGGSTRNTAQNLATVKLDYPLPPRWYSHQQASRCCTRGRK